MRLVLVNIRNPDALEPDLRRARELSPEHLTIALLGHAVRSMDLTAPDRDWSYKFLLRNRHRDPALFDELFGKTYYNIAEGLLEDGDLRQAALGYRRSLEFLPDRQHVLEGLAEALWGLSERQEATAALLRLAELPPENADAFYNAALAFNL